MRHVTKRISWSDLFSTDMEPRVRRERWEEWKTLCANEPEQLAQWIPECVCVFLDGDWCKALELPAAVNPFLTFEYGMVGMACMGMGAEMYSENNEQLTL